MCDNSHLSLEFITRKADGMLLYNGPIVPPETDEVLVSGKLVISDIFIRHIFVMVTSLDLRLYIFSVNLLQL
jgi:hypothetical protein